VKSTVRGAVVLGIIAVLSVVAANADTGASYSNVKAIGMGDTRVAGGMEYNGFVDNPALLSRVKHFRMSLATVPVSVNKNLSDIAKFINDNRDRFSNFDQLSDEEKDQFIKDVEPFDGKWARMNVSPMVDIATTVMHHSLGLAVYSVNDINFKIDRGIYEPRVWGEGQSDIAVVLGYAQPLSILAPGLTVGVNVKYTERRTAELFQIKASDLGNINDTLQPILDKAKNSTSSHYAVDVGALWNAPVINADVGAVLKNFGFGPDYTLDLGIAKRFFGDRIVLLGDYVDFLDKDRENAWKKVHLGGEIDLGLINLRAGINSGYPSLGAGLNLKLMQIDAAYYSDELSNAPGGDEDPRMAVQMRIGW
jgi:hypothetical protein